MLKFNKKSCSATQSGQVSRLLLVLAVIVFVAVVIVYLVMRMANPAPRPPVATGTPAEMPVYEKQLSDIDFIYESAIDRGNVLSASQVTNQQYSFSQKDLTTTERFIQVTIGAQNKGTVNTEQGAWTIENIIDSKGREFVPDDQYAVAPWLPSINPCGALLKPAFEPTPCTKIYEVSNESTGLKIRVEAGKDDSANNLSSGKSDSFLLDLIVK